MNTNRVHRQAAQYQLTFLAAKRPHRLAWPIHLGLVWLIGVALSASTIAQEGQHIEKSKAVSVDANPWIATFSGDLPIVISAPHGGRKELPKVDVRKGEGMEKGGAGFFAGRDSGTEELAILVVEQLKRRLKHSPSYVISKVHRKYIDFNRPAEIAYEDADAKEVYDLYHGSLDSHCKKISESFHCGLLLDIHGQGTDKTTVFRGTQNGKTTTHLRETFGEEAVSGPKSLFGILKDRHWHVFPDPLDGKEQAGFTGGYIVRTYGDVRRYPIDAFQLEFGNDFRNAEHRQQTANDLADAIVEFSERYLSVPGTRSSEK